MSIEVTCDCGVRLTAPEHNAGTRGRCPHCGATVVFPETKARPVGQPAPVVHASPVAAQLVQPPLAKPVPMPPRAAAEIGAEPSSHETIPPEDAPDAVSFSDPTTASVPDAEATEEQPPWARRMFEALLDPRSIHWLLSLGGGLMVLGLIVWLVSRGVFENRLVVTVSLGIGSLAILGAGWYVTLSTRYKIAGQALTFLGCVVLPLNLWYCHSQGLLTLDGRLWQAGLACCLLYAATVYVLRNPVFLYAVEVGVSLTMLLLLGSLGHASTGLYVSFTFMGLALVSIFAEQAFDPRAEVFTRQRFGMPLFWSGQIQLALSLFVLLFCQSLGWAAVKLADSTWAVWVMNSFSDRFLLAGGLWLVGTCVYLYSDLMVRRVGAYAYLAALCLVMAVVTLGLGFHLNLAVLITVFALMGLAATLFDHYCLTGRGRLGQSVLPLALILSCLPLLLGILLHLSATSSIAGSFIWIRGSGWPFVAAMLVVVGANRTSAFLYRRVSPRMSATYFFLSAAGLIVAAAGFLRVMELDAWHQQAPLLMLIPIGYLVAGRLWRGHSPERPLGWVAHSATAVILAHVVLNMMTSWENLESVFRPAAQQPVNLWLGITFAEAAVFYLLAAHFRRESLNVYFAMLAMCGAIWELAGYANLFDAPYYTMIYSVLGLVFLIAARLLGIRQEPAYRAFGMQATTVEGKGLPAYQGGNAVLLVAFLAAVLQSLVRLESPDQVGLLSVVSLAITTGVSLTAIWLVPRGPWRRLYAVSTVALTVVTCLTLNLIVQLHAWQKLEIVCVTSGLLLIAASYVGRFREGERPAQRNDVVTIGLWLGSLLAVLPLIVAVNYHRVWGGGPSLVDEMAILSVTILMLVTGLSWRMQSTTLIGGGALTLYLVIMLGRLAYHPQVAVGVYLAVGGALVFLAGIVLSICRERLLALPERIANRQGIFRVISWR